MENPASESIAKIFMAEGRTGTGDHSDAYPMDVCNPNTLSGSVLNFDLQGRTPQHPAGVDYDMQPLRLNPRSVTGQDSNIKEDGEGR